MKFIIIVSLVISAKIFANALFIHPKEVKSPKSLNKTRLPRKAHNLSIKENYLESEIYNEEIEEDTLKCPDGCYCQYGYFLDLPISKWITFMQERHKYKVKKDETNSNEGNENFMDTNSNEVHYNLFNTVNEDSFMKQATCLLQDDINPRDLINKLPRDLGALTLLYTGANKNKTIITNDLKKLNQLIALEIRGTEAQSLTVVFEEPLQYLQFASFEFIRLMGNQNYERIKTKEHLENTFDYKPRGELYDNNNNKNVANYTTTTEKKQLLTYNLEEYFEILPYEEYKAKLKKAQMINFYGWKSLEVLRIHSCQLSELHWDMFDGLETLEHMSLEYNEIELITPFALYGALNIKTLSLAHNWIHSLHYRSLAGLLYLEWLDLSENRLEKLSEMSFPPFPKLRIIDFRKNPIHYILPATFLIMNSTEEMHFESKDVALELWNNKPFEALIKLKELTLNNVSINSLQQNIFKDLISLEKLQVRGKVFNIEFDAFTDLVNLKELDLSYCQIRELSMDAFLGMKQLKIIYLNNNNLSYIPANLFDDQKFLEEIYLNNNNLQTISNHFFWQPKLKLARLDENPWKCSCDMLNWRSKITNQIRGANIERCYTDYNTGKKISCRSETSYIFERKLTPRCKNYNGRSVYYVIRKNLQCGTKPILYGSKTHHKSKQTQTPISHWRKFSEIPHRLNKDHLKWQTTSTEKIKKETLPHFNENNNEQVSKDFIKEPVRNSLHWLISNRASDDITKVNKNSYNLNDNSYDISNEI